MKHSRAPLAGGVDHRLPTRRPGALFCALGALCCALAPLCHAIEGLYVRVELGAGLPSDLSLTRTNHGVPTNCDQWLRGYDFDGDGVDDVPLPPGQCTPRALPANANRIGVDPGYMAGASIGVGRGRWRAELDYSRRRHGGKTASLVVPGDPKQQEFVRREEVADEVRADSLFANLYWEFPRRGGRWTPYIGAGLGAKRMGIRYAATSVRTSDADALIAIGRNPDAAGTTSRADAALSDTLYGYQVMTGARLRLDERRSLDLKLRYGDSWEDFAAGGTRWRTLRDHASTVAPGGAPVFYDIAAGGLSAWSVSAGLAWRLR